MKSYVNAALWPAVKETWLSINYFEKFYLKIKVFYTIISLPLSLFVLGHVTDARCDATNDMTD